MVENVRGEGEQELSESEVSTSDNNSGMLATVRAERVAVSNDGEREGSTRWIFEWEGGGGPGLGWMPIKGGAGTKAGGIAKGAAMKMGGGARATTGAARGAAMAMGGGAKAGKGAASGAAMKMGGTIGGIAKRAAMKMGGGAKATTGAARGAAVTTGGGANAGKGAANGAAMTMMGGTTAEVGAVVVAVKAAGVNNAKWASIVLEEDKMAGEEVEEKLGSGGG
jgi:hypothetical protein